jgi:hypothetical protein
MWIRLIVILGDLILIVAVGAAPAMAGIMTFNSNTPADNAATRLNWLNAIGITAPQYLVDFESGFTNNQNISGVTGLFPAGLVITDTSGGNAAIIRSGAGVINGSNPVGVFSLTHNESRFLQLDFQTDPVDYIGFQDIDHSGTTGIVTFVGGGTASISFETTGASGNTAEFFGIFRNDMPRIARVQLDAGGDGRWGVDNIKYGVVDMSGMISGLVTLQNCTNHSGQITFEIRSPGTTAIAVDANNDEDPAGIGTQVTTEDTGAYTLQGIPPGTYDLTAKGSKWLRKKVNDVEVSTGGNTVVDFLSLKGGDANDTNSVNILDLNILKASYGKSDTQPGYDARADFNKSDSVNILDLNILKANYGQSGQ